uniref:Uncharacterized protein n=1 Tax=Rhizophora mucronata TaxID=61149 RepID=A0A2P2QF43_RHIMU
MLNYLSKELHFFCTEFVNLGFMDFHQFDLGYVKIDFLTSNLPSSHLTPNLILHSSV